MKIKNKKVITIILIGIMLLICTVAIIGTTSFSNVTAYAAEDVEVSPSSPPLTEEDVGGIFAGLWNAIKDFFYGILGGITLFVLWVVDSMFALISVLAGSGMASGEQGILEALFAEDGIKKAIFGITALGSVLVLIVGAFAVFRRSTSDNHGAVGTVVKNMMKAVALFIAVPLLVVALIFIVNMLIQGINLSITGNVTNGSFGSMLFKAGAEQVKDVDLSTFFKTEMPIEMYNVQTLVETIKSVKINIQDVNWLVILAGGGALLWFCAPVVVMLVSRLFELVILYVLDAIPIAFMPYDDGERFDHWKSEFMQKFMSAYGVVLSYSLFGMLMPTIMKMKLFEGNSFFQIIIILGGAFFMNKAPELINGILGVKGGLGESLGGRGINRGLAVGARVAGGAAIGAGLFAAGKAGGGIGRILPTKRNKINRAENKARRAEIAAERIQQKRAGIDNKGVKLTERAERLDEKRNAGGKSERKTQRLDAKRQGMEKKLERLQTARRKSVSAEKVQLRKKQLEKKKIRDIRNGVYTAREKRDKEREKISKRHAESAQNSWNARNKIAPPKKTERKIGIARQAYHPATKTSEGETRSEALGFKIGK